MFFPSLDGIRRAQGRWLDALGYGPIETPSWTALSAPGLRVKTFSSEASSGPPLLFIPAPIKRDYIFDLAPGASAVAAGLAAGHAVFLLEWSDPGGEVGSYGLDDYADRLIGMAVDAAVLITGARRCVLVGHSLGGTLAALHAARRPERVAGLALLEAPLIFDAAHDAFAPWLRTPPMLRLLFSGTQAVAGSELTLAALTAAPEAFLWERWGDALSSAADPQLRSLHLQVLRWTLDEMAIPAPLFRAVLNDLYRANRLRDRSLCLSGATIGLSDIKTPIFAVAERDSRVVPVENILPALSATASPDVRVRIYEGDVGVALSHVGVLVGAQAHRQLWPELLAWAAAL